MKSACLLLMVFMTITFSAFSQTPAADLIKNLEQDYGANISLHPSTGLTRFILFPAGNGPVLDGHDEIAKAWQFLEDFGALWSVEAVDENFIYKQTRTDVAGNQHLVFQQYHRGVSTFDGELRFHFDQEKRLTAVSGVVLPIADVDTQPQIDESTAVQLAKTLLDKGNKFPYELLVRPRLMVYYQGLAQGIAGRSFLTYELLMGDNLTDRQYVYIDAITGAMIERLPANCSVLNRELYDGDTSGSPIWEESDGNIENLNGEEESIMKSTGHTYYLFQHAFGYDSYDNAGANMKGVVDATNVNCPNATWNGTSANFCTSFGVDDIVAHEWGHAYTEYTNNLIYAWQAGAINEAYSDIWGETVDLLNNFGDDTGHDMLRTACNSSIRWQLGEERGSVIRDMWMPSCEGDPNAVTANNYWCSTGDSGGVHINSGIPNHAYALLVDGGTFNGETVAGIGITKAAHIFWQAQSQYLSRTSDFNLLAIALQAACADLVGVDLPALGLTESDPGLSGEVMTTADCDEVDHAIAAVAMTAVPDCSFSPLFDENIPQICELNDFQTIYSDDFESGAAGWTFTELPSNPGTWDSRNWELNSNLPEGRPGQGLFGPDPVVGDCSSDLDNGIIELTSPLINIPANFEAPIYLTFDHYVSMELNWDGGIVQYQINGGNWMDVSSSDFTFNPYNISLRTAGQGNDNPLAGMDSFSGADEGSVLCTWGTSHILIGPQAANTIRFRWQLGVDGCNGWDGWYIDDVEVGGCASLSLPVSWQTFTVAPKGAAALLEWTTSSELNNAGFWVERSANPAEGFKSLKWIEGAGNTQSTQLYTYEDTDLRPGITYYYRLRQIDFDGQESLSQLRVFSLSTKNIADFNVYPNPVQSTAQLTWLGTNSEQLAVSIYHADGRLAKASTYFQEISSGQPLTLDFSSLSAGVYWVVVRTAEGALVRKRILVG